MRQLLLAAAAVAVGACSETRERLVVHTVSERTGAPVAGIRVQVEGQPWATAGADGTAAFDAVAGSFTVLLHESRTWPEGSSLHLSDSVHVLRGRSGNEVFAEVSGPGPLQWHSARVSGAVAARSAPSTSVVRVGAAPFGRGQAWPTVAAGDGSFDFDLPWHTAPSESAATATLHAWESDGASPPAHYYGFGRSGSISLIDGGAVTATTIVLEPVTEGTVEGVLSLPGALASVSVHAELWLTSGRHEHLQLAWLDPVPLGSLALVVPSVPGAERWIGVWAGPARHLRRVDVPSTGLEFAPPSPPVLLDPAAGAAIGDDTLFRWSPPAPGGSSTIYVNCSWTDPVIGYSTVSYLVEAEGTQTTLPHIPDVAIDPSAACDWSVDWCAAADRAAEERCASSELRAAGGA